MSELKIVKITVRRGTDTERQAVILDEGEIGYTTDTKRVFIGDGYKLGGHPVGTTTYINATSATRTTLLSAVVGDSVYETNLFWTLTALPPTTSTNWASTYTKIDNSLTYKSTQMDLISSGEIYMPKIGVTNYGVISSLGKTVNISMSANGTTYYGHISDTANGSPGAGKTLITAISSNNASDTRTFELSSAGFAVVNMGYDFQGNLVGQVAVPIFAIPSDLKTDLNLIEP
jgi:hypothetical protein